MRAVSQNINGKLYDYRYGSTHYDGKLNYYIERRINNGKWKMIIGGLSYKDAHNFLDNPVEIEQVNTMFKRTKIGILIFVCFMIIYWICTYIFN